MTADRHITLYHAAPSRSSGTLLLLAELGAPYDIQLLDMKAGEHRQPPYLAVNPMGKVPAIRHGEAIVTEQVAIVIYLADLFPEAGLAPPIGDPLRGPYLRWVAFYGSCFEPAVIDRHLKREAGPRPMVPYADFETMYSTLVGQLERGPYMLGERFSAADLLWVGALAQMTEWKLVPDHPAIAAYVARHHARPAVQRVKAKDEALVAAKAAG